MEKFEMVRLLRPLGEPRARTRAMRSQEIGR